MQNGREGNVSVLYLKVSRDKYELPEAVADSIKEMAVLQKTTPNAIHRAFSLERVHGVKNRYIKVEIDDEDEEDETDI